MGKDQELLEAARNGNVAIVDKILGQRAKRSGPLASLRRGPGANVQDSSGYSALHHAALNGHREVVKLLLQYEASTNIVDSKGSSPLHLAAWSGNSEIVRLILTQGPSVPNVNLLTKDTESPLHCAAQYGHTEVVGQLLQAGCDPSIRNSRGESALDLAAQYGRLETVELLVRAHPELIQSLRSSSSSLIFPHTPLHLASRNGHRACVEVLLDAGVDVNTRTSAGTALHEAALCGKVEVVRTLLDRGVDLNIKDSRRNTVLDLLSQFPAHVTQDITAVIKRYRLSSGIECDGDSENLPPIPVQRNESVSSPYENVRPGDDYSPAEGSSPTRWPAYHKPRDFEEDDYYGETLDVGAWQYLSSRQRTEDGSDLSSVFDSVLMSMSDTLNSINTLASDQTPEDRPSYNTNLITTPSRDTLRNSDSGLYQTPPAPRALTDTTSAGYASEDQLSMTLPGSGYYGYSAASRESDQLSVSSSSSFGGPSPRERRCVPTSATGIYLPMAPLSSSQATSNKISNGGMPSNLQPTPPKKPPRRNLSVSPTHTQASTQSDGQPTPMNYEYMFMARTGRGHNAPLLDLEELQTRRQQLRHVTRSVDQYVDMKSSFGHQRNHSQDSKKADSDVEPVAITAITDGNRSLRIANPRRKLRRHTYGRSSYENHSAQQQDASDKSPCNSEPGAARDRTYISNAFIAVKSSQESLVDECEKTTPRPKEQPATPQKQQQQQQPQEVCTDKRLKRVQNLQIPTSPTHYAQPPTPDHPPPSAVQAEKSIHDRIRPLSEVYKRRSRDMETETEEELLVQFPAANANNSTNNASLDASSGSLSSVSLSDKSMSTDNVEEYFGDVPFAGLLKGSISTAERPRTLRRLRNVYSPAGEGGCGVMGTGADILAGNNDHQRDHDAMNNHHHHHRNKRDGAAATTNGGSGSNGDASDRDQQQSQDDKSLALMSPFDEQEEWAKISEIMATFGTSLVRESVFVTELEREFQSRLSFNSDTDSPCVMTLVGQWLSKLNLADYESAFINYGFDDLEFINGVIEESDLDEMGINSENDRATIMEAAAQLNNRVEARTGSNVAQTVDDWLKSIHLESYAELFRRHLYTDMDKVRRVWEVELAAVLEIQKIAHRKRILASVNGGTTSNSSGGSNGSSGAQTRSTSSSAHNNTRNNGNGPSLNDLNKDLNALKSNIQQLKSEIREKMPEHPQNSNGLPAASRTSAASTPTSSSAQVIGTNANTTGTLKARKNRPAPPPPQKPNVNTQNGTAQPTENLEIRGPSELLFGVPSTLKTQWRHQPKDLVTGNVIYVANYLGSTIVKELRGTESSLKSIQKLKKVGRDPRCTPDITLSISFRGVRFLNTLTDEPICEHEIRNIHCACQDADDLTHFAYITKDHASQTHFCHVFCVPTMDQATEIILTLGQAFEVAYQIALKDKFGTQQAVRSQSANQLATLAMSSPSKVMNSPSREGKPTYDNHINESNKNHYHTSTNPRPKSRSKTISNPFIVNSNMDPPPHPPNNYRHASPHHKTSAVKKPNNSHSGVNANSRPSAISNSVKLLATHGRSHSVNEIKLNGNQNKISSVVPVDDISIGVKDMKAGSRAPIALTEEL
uniref:Ankyrin repeat and SAM domain-containing protein 1A n=1 Tax=Trichogramma kaykai TaxID=54128 RepID=A0ABD2XRP4_9HYME